MILLEWAVLDRLGRLVLLIKDWGLNGSNGGDPVARGECFAVLVHVVIVDGASSIPELDDTLEGPGVAHENIAVALLAVLGSAMQLEDFEQQPPAVNRGTREGHLLHLPSDAFLI